MKKRSEGRLAQAALLAALQEGAISIPLLLLKAYPQLKLTDMEAMLLIQLLTFVEKDRNGFPTIEEIQRRMASPPDLVIRALHKLMNDGWITIDEEVDEGTGIQSERYNLTGFYDKLARYWSEQTEQGEAESAAAGNTGSDLYSMFEHEFGRPLTPMEYETITGWLEQDKHQEQLIVAALKEAVFAGKIHFRYVDRILLEWERNRIKTVEQAKAHAQKFRGARG